MAQLSRSQRNQLLSLMRQWRTESQAIDHLLSGAGWTGTSFDIARASRRRRPPRRSRGGSQIVLGAAAGLIARLRGLAWRWAALGGVGLALLLAPGAHATEFADPTVVTPLFLEDLHGGNPLLSHNVPNLLLVIGGLEHRASFRDHFLATGKIERWGLATSEVLREEPNSLTQYYQRG